jgi:2-keto-4-pentenoate hydratase/2-oxohepta-3-ene-1,7-dioic acid hydratase in catechol pathway
MRVVRILHGGTEHFGKLENDQVTLFQGNPIEGAALGAETLEFSDCELLAPVQPSKVICIGMNYAAHAAEISQSVPDEPLMFFKPISAIIGPNQTIVLPYQSKKVELEAELTVVIGKQAKDITPEQAKDHIFGFTIANDVTARDLQFSDLQWARSKGFDTFCPLGPWIETEFSSPSKTVQSRINGEVRQHATTNDMNFDVETLVSYVSQNVTLFPGDIILTGSPAGISKISEGDFVECEIEGIGVLSNPVA